jgi:hypothetical protein
VRWRAHFHSSPGASARSVPSCALERIFTPLATEQLAAGVDVVRQAVNCGVIGAGQSGFLPLLVRSSNSVGRGSVGWCGRPFRSGTGTVIKGCGFAGQRSERVALRRFELDVGRCRVRAQLVRGLGADDD